MKISRRNFALTIPFIPLLAYANGPELLKTEKSVVWIWLGGGIANQEFSNPVDGPNEYASVNGYIETKSGFRLGSNFQNIANFSDKMTLVRNLKHRDANHNTATHWMNTSIANPAGGEDGPQKEPSFGSITSHYVGINNNIGIPNYIKLNRIRYDGPAWLGSEYMGFLSDDNSIKNMSLGLDKDRIDKRMDIVKFADDKYFDKSKKWSFLRDTAYELSVGNASRAFKLELEDIDTQNKYEIGKSGFGKNLLMTRRLLQNVARWINITHDGWDMHNNIAQGFNNRAPELDKLLSVFIQDLIEHDMLDTTLIVVTSEFSRTKVNKDNGRDHNPNNIPLIMIGGPSSGRVVGKTSKDGLDSENPYGPEDLWWTVGNFLSIPKSYTIVSDDRRPHHIFQESAKDIL